MGSDDDGRTELHPRRDDSNGGASCSCRSEADWTTILESAEADAAESEGWADAHASYLRAQIAKATAWYQAVDGLHPRDAEKKA